MITSGRCVLVVDDDTSIRESLRMALEDTGYVVEEAPDGDAALTCLRAAPERLVVLLDVLMPGMNGLEMLQAVVADPHLATRHVYIVMTAAAEAPPPGLTDLRARLQVPLLIKPFDIDTLLAVVAEAADRLA